MTSTPTLITHFEPQLLSKLGVANQRLHFWLRYEPTLLQKTGLKALLAKTPFGKDEPLAMDIGLVCGLYNQAGKLIESVWYGNLRDCTNLVRHHGDRFVGMNKNYHPHTIQQTLSIRLSQLPKTIQQVVLFVHARHKQALKSAIMGECGLSDDAHLSLHQLAFASLDDETTTLAVWQLTRVNDDWRMQFLLQPIAGKQTDDDVAKRWQAS